MQNRDWLRYKGYYLERIKTAIGEANYQMIHPDILDDFAAIGACLATSDVVTKHLMKLNNELKKELERLGKIEVSTNGNDEIIKKEGKVYVSNYKVLTSYINAWCKTHGFNQGGTLHVCTNDGDKDIRTAIDLPKNQMPILMDLVKPEVFRAVLLTNGYLFKDLGAGYLHGEFTHFVDMYTVIEENNDTTPFLKNDPLTLYTLLGNKYCFGNREGIWDVIFDETAQDTINKPEILHQMITEATSNDLAIVSSIIKGRENKRNLQGGGSVQDSGAILGGLQTINFFKLKNYIDGTGIIIDNALFFKDSSFKDQKKMTYDEVFGLEEVDNNLTPMTLPKVYNDKEKLIDNLLNVFDSTQWKADHSNDEKREALNIYEELKKANPNSHKEIMTILINQQPQTNQEYVKALIHAAKTFCIESDIQKKDGELTAVKYERTTSMLTSPSSFEPKKKF